MRIDAYSQGVPVIASDTTGLRSCVYEGETGLLCAPGDPAILAQLLRYASNHREDLHRFGMNSLARARKMTHQGMHQTRAKLLAGLVGSVKMPGLNT
jgi:glycosyltransferase involved in cell wall biosynthesis